MSAGGDSWNTATSFSVPYTSDPVPLSNYPVGGSQPYFSQWFVFTATSDELLVFDTLATTGSAPDTQIYVWSGADEASKVQEGFNDDISGTNYLSQVAVSVTSGTTYHIQIGTFDSTDDGSQLVLTVAPYVEPVYSFVTVSDHDNTGWHNAKDHALIPWDSTHAVAVFSHATGANSDGGGGIRMLTVAPTGAITLGPIASYYTDAVDSETNWEVHSTIKVGNLIVQWRATTNNLYTMAYDSGSNTFSRVDSVAPVFGGGELTGNNYKGGKLVAIDSTTILLIKHGFNFSSSLGQMMYAQWNGTSWDFGAVTSVSGLAFGSRAYMDAEPLTGGVLVRIKDPSSNAFYGIVTGSYPAAPSLHQSIAMSGTPEYFNREWATADMEPGAVLRFIPCTSGTTTPIIGGASSFDWGLMRLTISGGEVVEGPIVNVGPTTDYYDVAGAQTLDGATWVVHEQSTAGTPPNSILEVRNVDTNSVSTISTSEDQGIVGNDYSIRNIVAVGNVAVVGFRTNSQDIFGVMSFGGTPAVSGSFAGWGTPLN